MYRFSAREKEQRRLDVQKGYIIPARFISGNVGRKEKRLVNP
jgi:hypothetical protein